jgi:murein DD-endopeptidase MepM/ murein hydrolase activator NlpD
VKNNLTANKGSWLRQLLLDQWLPWLLWAVVVVLLAVLTTILIKRSPLGVYDVEKTPEVAMASAAGNSNKAAGDSVTMPVFTPDKVTAAMERETDLHTIIPSRSRATAASYTVGKGDSVFSIANKYKLKPETVLWANYDLLDDNPNMLSVGQNLTIPPVDGIYYKWAKNDKLDEVASKYKVTTTDIVGWPGNKMDLTDPKITADSYVMIPGGWRENRQWLVPTIWRANSGASRGIKAQCELPESGAVGTGAFMWPTSTTFISGNDYWSGHLGIDIGAAEGSPLYAADSGLVVYAGSIGGGYGLMIMIDHGNGYHTLYAHNSQILAKCGQSVSKGQVIGYTGNTGNSTGAHLHFEVRYNGGYINPHYVLP